MEKDSINELLRRGVIVIASGGGGIAVRLNRDAIFSGVDAVIDKNRAGFKLAQAVNTDRFLILTHVEKVFLNFNTPEQKAPGNLSLEQAETYFEEGHFLRGSMGPKVQPTIRFVRWSEKEAIITSLDKAVAAMEGKTGSRIEG